MVLRGYSGYNTRWALKALDKVFPEETAEDSGAPVAVTVFFGANDACLPDRCSGFQHVPVDEYEKNLHAIVTSLQVCVTLFLYVRTYDKQDMCMFGFVRLVVPNFSPINKLDNFKCSFFLVVYIMLFLLFLKLEIH